MKKFFLFLLLLGLGAWFVWPTRYQEYAGGQGPYAAQAGPAKTRVDRITGEVFVIGATGEWQSMPVRRPELLRPDITGPNVNTQPDTRGAQRQMQETRDMQTKTDEMMRSTEQAARSSGQ